ncbi:MAG: hypothetical protein WCQ67_00755 [Treponema sp.]
MWKRTAGTAVLSVSCFFLLSTLSCGLDTYPYLYAPSIVHQSDYNSSDYLSNYFSFYTADSKNNGLTAVTFKGTEVYYKIFNNYSTMTTYQGAINTLINDDDFTSAAEKIIETQGYKTIKLSTGSITPLIKQDNGNDRYVYIRLTDYNDGDLKAGICLNNTDPMSVYDEAYALTYNGTVVYPRRNISSKYYTFNFGGDNTDTDVVPKEGDDDVCYSETASEEGTWYVSMYVLSVGIDTSTWIKYYSKPILLGSVSIVEGEKN